MRRRYEPPKVIIKKLWALKDEIRGDLDTFEGLLG
jgi:hypothetical protein